jgi:hypothetical protein
VVALFITEVTGIDVLYPDGEAPDPYAEQFPENWYQEIGRKSQVTTEGVE